MVTDFDEQLATVTATLVLYQQYEPAWELIQAAHKLNEAPDCVEEEKALFAGHVACVYQAVQELINKIQADQDKKQQGEG